MGKGEPTVDHQTTLRLGKQAVRTAAGLVEVDEGRRIGDEEGVEAEVFEDEFVGGALDGREGKEGLG